MAAPSSSEFGFAFVAENGLERPNKATDRRLIRSRCMRGKNRKIGVIHPLLQRQPFPVCHGGSATVGGRGDAAAVVLPRHSSRNNRRGKVVEEDQDGGRNDQETEDKLAVAEVASNSLTLHLSPSGLKAVHLAFEMPVRYKAQVFDFLRLVHAVTSAVTRFVDYDISQAQCGQWVTSDPAFLQCCVFMSFAITDVTQQRSVSPATLYHLQKTIEILKLSLSNPDRSVALRDTTIGVVITLTLVSCMINDRVSARAHLNGLRQMIKLRGELHIPARPAIVEGPLLASHSYGMVQTPELPQACCLVDLVYALSTGDRGSQLTTYPETFLPCFYDIGLPAVPTDCVDPSVFAPAADPRIQAVFRDMQYYASTVNSVDAMKYRRPADEYHKVHSSLQYRLLALQGQFEIYDERDGGVSECLRLALLAVLVTMFQFPGMRIGFSYLTDRYRQCCQKMRVGNHAPSRDLMRWLLITGANTVFDLRSTNEQWMLERWRDDVDPLDWDGTKAKLKEICWIDALPDQIGRDVLNRFNKYRLFAPA
ncbi:hypothetical protein BJY01DRAFT_217129 [Aspergillus pseudoustus]|uniref:Fungal-specific transcription factor domain-containing protein n=1 Tax=Aspergillus pseudoustus TaxID=1810923 RepID=A0ABR4JRM4_9EURO